jgi:hypothetical protein
MATGWRSSYGGPFTSPERGEARGGARDVARSAPAFERVGGVSPLARGAKHSVWGLARRLVEPCETLLCDLVRQGLSPEAVPAAAALILLLEADASEREAEAA